MAQHFSETQYQVTSLKLSCIYTSSLSIFLKQAITGERSKYDQVSRTAKAISLWELDSAVLIYFAALIDFAFPSLRSRIYI